MVENISIIKNALKTFSSSGEYEASRFLLAAGSLRTSNPNESALLQKIGDPNSRDNFVAFDKDGNGKISNKEIEEGAKFFSPNDILDEKDLQEALNRLSRTNRRKPASSRSSSPPSSSSPTSLPKAPAVPQIENYASNLYKEGKPAKDPYFGIKSTITLDPIKLDHNREVKTFLGEDGLLHIVIYNGKNFSENNLISEYTVSLKRLHEMAISQKSIFLTFQKVNYDFEKSFARQAGAKEHLDASSPENKDKVTQLIKDLFLAESSLNTLKNTPGVQFRKARGVSALKEKAFQTPSTSTIQLEEVNSILNELEGYANFLTTNPNDKSKTVYSTGKSQALKLIRYVYNGSKYPAYKGKTFYKLIRVNNPANPASITEYDIPEAELTRIAERDAQNVDLNDLDQTINWLANHFKLDTNKIDAYTERQDGFAQFGEIRGLFQRVTPVNGKPLQQVINGLQREEGTWTRTPFESGILSIPDNYPGVVDSKITTYFSRLKRLYDLKPDLTGSSGDGPPKDLTTFQVGDEIKKIIVENKGIKILIWKVKGGRLEYSRAMLISREDLTGKAFSKFAALTPRFVESALSSRNPEEKAKLNYLIQQAKIYFGHNPSYAGNAVGLDLGTHSTELENEIKRLESGS